MRTIKYILPIALCVFATSLLLSQDIETYKLQLPEIILEKGGPIYVSPLADSTKEEIKSSLSTTFQKEMVQGLNADGLAFNQKLPSFNPWMRTNLYSTTENKDEATYVISGDYMFATNQVKSYTEQSSAESSDSIPFVYYEFQEKSTANVTGRVIITDTETNSEIANIPFSKFLSDEDKKIMQQASAKDPHNFIAALSDDFVKTFRYRFSAVKSTYKYEFPKIKPEDKDLKKEFRQYKRDLKDLADAGKLKELYNIYLEIQQKEDSPEVNECIGMCYEIVGNYTQAKTYYDNSDSQTSKNRIVEQINIQKRLLDFGFTINEPEI
ncbi:MAG: hypothetical protein PHE33_10545 [Bacteroidales bacterium]|nr:hypothetical protein [Bacteroidales bacterium]